MRLRILLAAEHPLRPHRTRLPSGIVNQTRRPLFLQSIQTKLKELVQSVRSRDEQRRPDSWLQRMAQAPVPPQGDIALLQQLLGLVPRTDESAELQDVVFVCIDCEAYEMNREQITEVGVSVLDTTKIDHINPEMTASDLIPLIESAHYRIREYGHLRNRRFVKGNPAAFAFGSSTWVKKDNAKTVLSRLFDDPANLSNASQLEQPLIGPARNVVLVAHGIKNEFDYLNFLGFALDKASNVVRRMDTSSILTSKKSQVSLKNLLQMVDIQVDKEHLHNAGNDAAYTLRAFLTLGTNEHATPGYLTAGLQQMRAREAEKSALRTKARKAAKAAKEAQQNGAKEKSAIHPTAQNVASNSSKPSEPLKPLREKLAKAARKRSKSSE